MTELEIKNAISQGRTLYHMRADGQMRIIHHDKYTYWFDKQHMYIQKHKWLYQIKLADIKLTKFEINNCTILNKALDLACEKLNELIKDHPGSEYIKTELKRIAILNLRKKRTEK